MSRKFLTICLYFILTAALLNTSSLCAGEYLFDVLTKQNYANSWNKLISSEKNVDSWLLNYFETKNGPAFPGKIVQLSDGEYQINGVCKTHDCGDNIFYVLFSSTGNKAWGLLVTNTNILRYFGNPNDEQKEVLSAESKK